MPRSLSGARCTLTSNLLARRSAGPPAIWNARTERGRLQRRASHRTERRGATSRTRTRTGR